MTARVIFDATAPRTRQCGTCTLCCKLLPVRGLKKPANTRCKHQSHSKGCAVYRKPWMPVECVLWSCRWLVDKATEALSRPDRVHYVIDTMPDYVSWNDNGVERRLEVVQVWCDPDHPDAHRDPHLREYLGKMAEEGIGALVRYGSRVGFFLCAPAFSPDGQWHEVESQRLRRDHTPLEIVQALGTQYKVTMTEAEKP